MNSAVHYESSNNTFLFSKLGEGDSGLIVYLVLKSGERRPYGMFVGELDLGEESEDFGSIYQAIVLHQALRNIEIDYPHHVENIQSYMIPPSHENILP